MARIDTELTILVGWVSAAQPGNLSVAQPGPSYPTN